MERKILDIIDFDLEWIKIIKQLDSIWHNLIALTFDYRQFINNSLIDNEIIEIRDNIDYRFFSIRLHAELLIRKQYEIENRVKELLVNDPNKVLGQYFTSNPNFDIFQKEISAIFDSFLYHLVSIFDYVANLINYICGEEKSKMSSLRWTQLANASRDINSHIGKKEIAKIIAELDNKFVHKLYDYRSFLIHRKSDLSEYSFSFQFINTQNITINYFATKRFIKHFSELKLNAKDYNLSLKYVLVWLTNKTVELVTKIIFGLKKEMESFTKTQKPMFFVYDKESNNMLRASIVYKDLKKQNQQ